MENVLSLQAKNRQSLHEFLSDPPVEFANGPLWVWNDRMTEERIIHDLEMLKSQNVRHAYIHPRPGLMTPYLSEEWMEMYAVSLREAERLGMLLWIYDENSYPSGFAGGLVPDAMPESRGKGLRADRVKSISADKLPESLHAVYAFEQQDETLTVKDITSQAKKTKEPIEGNFLVTWISLAGSTPWFGGKYYVDLLKPGVTEKFIEITMDAYKERFGDKFGSMILGWFTDEPHLKTAGGLTWSDDLEGRYQKRWKRSLRKDLPALHEKVGDWQRVRYCFYQQLNEEFCDQWGKICYDYCEENNLYFTGHYWEHGWPDMTHASDTMAMYQWHQAPAIDILMNQYREDTHAQFGNVRAVKEVTSVANQMGRHRILCETYGAGGWDLRFEDMKRIGDWIYVLGVNVLNQHLTYSTLRGARKRDHPQSFSYHTPWWEAYHTSATYFERLSATLTAGRQVNKILVLEPTTTAWLYLSPTGNDKRLGLLGERFQTLTVELEAAQIEYDIGSEDLMMRHGSIENGMLKVGECTYSTVVIPEDMENINATTLKLLTPFEGMILSLRDVPPTLLDGIPTQKAQDLVKQPEFWMTVSRDEIMDRLRERHSEMPRFERDMTRNDKLFHHRRETEDGQVLFLVNTSLDDLSVGSITLSGGGVEKLNLETGDVDVYSFEKIGDKTVKFTYNLPPAGSLMLSIPDEVLKVPVIAQTKEVAVQANGPTGVYRGDDNVLTLDYCSAQAGGDEVTDVHFVKAQTMVFNAHGMKQNPWDSSVQFKDELITKTFDAESGFSASYRIMIEERVPETLWAVVERPDLYSITLNGKPIKATPGAWYLDRCFGRLDLRGLAQVGENTLTLSAKPMTIYHEIESVYMVGAFKLKPLESGFAILPEESLTLGSWKDQGLPFYAARMVYQQQFDVHDSSGEFVVRLDDWYGSVAKVSVNGEEAGYIGNQPWECSVAGLLKDGRNVIDVTVYGTLKNTLGPHHNNPPLGTAWPSMFKSAPESGPPAGEDYHVVDYGLYAPFRLIQHVNV